MPRTARFVIAAAAMAVLASPAAAAPLRFVFTGSYTGGFVVDSDPTPTYIDANSFVAPFASATGDFAGSGGGEFYIGSRRSSGGLALYAGPGSSILVSASGAQLFSGTLSAPHFSIGAYTLQAGSGGTTRLTILGPGAPAPVLGGSLAGALAALGALAVTRRRRVSRAG